jgi:hypothetical protein
MEGAEVQLQVYLISVSNGVELIKQPPSTKQSSWSGGSKFLRNVRKRLPDYKTTKTRKQQCLCSPPWELQIRQETHINLITTLAFLWEQKWTIMFHSSETRGLLRDYNAASVHLCSVWIDSLGVFVIGTGGTVPNLECASLSLVWNLLVPQFRRSQWPHNVKHEQSSPAQTLGS